jgi:hypothetical protein
MSTSLLLGQLFERVRKEGLAVAFTMEDFKRQYAKEHFARLTPEEQCEALQALSPEQQQEMLQALPPEKRLAGLSAEQIEQVRQHFDRLAAEKPDAPQKSGRKK